MKLPLLLLIASFPCTERDNLSASEEMVCHNYERSQMDDEMLILTKRLMRSGKFRQTLVPEFESFVHMRENCGYDVNCIRRAYRGRLATLYKMIDSLDEE